MFRELGRERKIFCWLANQQSALGFFREVDLHAVFVDGDVAALCDGLGFRTVRTMTDGKALGAGDTSPC